MEICSYNKKLRPFITKFCALYSGKQLLEKKVCVHWDVSTGISSFSHGDRKSAKGITQDQLITQLLTGQLSWKPVCVVNRDVTMRTTTQARKPLLSVG